MEDFVNVKKQKMTPRTLSKLVIEIISWKKAAVVSESFGRIRRLMRMGVTMNTSAR